MDVLPCLPRHRLGTRSYLPGVLASNEPEWGSQLFLRDPTGCPAELQQSVVHRKQHRRNPYLRDLEAGRERWIQFPNAMAVDPSPSGPNAFFVLMGVEQNHEKLTGWVWKRPDTLEQLVDAGSEMVYDIRSDGNTLVWVQTASASSLDPATGTLWTSPFATSASGVESTQRRSVPALTIVPQYKVVGHGHYALVEQPVGSPERYLHVYRLSDARHWKVPTIPDVRPADLIYIDAEEVWFIGTTLNDAKSTIIRQKLDALGPGD